MEEQAPEGAEGTDRDVPEDGIPALPPELTTREEELRARIEAGAASPEELRDLAAQLKEQRTLEKSVWQREVRPALMKSKKRRFSLVDLRRESADGEQSNSLPLAVALAVAVVLLILIASNTSFLLLLIPVVALLVYAWAQGRRPIPEEAPDPPASDPDG